MSDYGTVVKFWVMETSWADLNAGMVEWSDGSIQHSIEVLKDPEIITPTQYLYLCRELSKHMVGLVSQEQISYVYSGVLDLILGTDWVEQMIANEVKDLPKGGL